MSAFTAREMRLAIPAKLENVALAGVTVRAICVFGPFDEQAALLVELAVCESLNNSILHALKGRRDETVHLDVILDGEGVSLTIYDCGLPMPGESLPRAEPPADPLAVNGRGMAIIHDVMDRVAYARQGGQNILTMYKLATRPRSERL